MFHRTFPEYTNVKRHSNFMFQDKEKDDWRNRYTNQAAQPVRRMANAANPSDVLVLT